MALPGTPLTGLPGTPLTGVPGTPLTGVPGTRLTGVPGTSLSSKPAPSESEPASEPEAPAPNEPVPLPEPVRKTSWEPVPIVEAVTAKARLPVPIEEDVDVASHAPVPIEEEAVVRVRLPVPIEGPEVYAGLAPVALEGRGENERAAATRTQPAPSGFQPLMTQRLRAKLGEVADVFRAPKPASSGEPIVRVGLPAGTRTVSAEKPIGMPAAIVAESPRRELPATSYGRVRPILPGSDLARLLPSELLQRASWRPVDLPGLGPSGELVVWSGDDG